MQARPAPPAAASNDEVGPPEDKAAGAVAQPSGHGSRGSSRSAGLRLAQTAGSEALPDLRDEPSLEDVPVTAGAAQGASPAKRLTPLVHPAPASPGARLPVAAPMAPPAQANPAVKAPAGSSGAAAGRALGHGGSGGGPLTPAEQVAILDAQLAKGAGDFDAMILKTEAEQRAAARAQAASRTTVIASGDQRVR